MSGFVSRLIRRGGSDRSIYEHVRAHVNPHGPGLLDGGAELPDEPGDSNSIRWAPGALDGVAGHHMGVDDDAGAVDRVVELLQKAADGGRSELRRLERELDDALKGTFPASDPLAVDSADEHAARRNRAAREKPGKKSR